MSGVAELAVEKSKTARPAGAQAERCFATACRRVAYPRLMQARAGEGGRSESAFCADTLSDPSEERRQ
jgi:hypothetical protein